MITATKSALLEQVKRLPAKPGVYLMKNARGSVIYVGKALSLRQRVHSYFQSPERFDSKTQRLVKEIATLDYLVADSEERALLLELSLIKYHRPHFNVRLKDDKTFPYIKVDLKDGYPRLYSTRRMEDDGGHYFGPFSSARAVKQTLRTIKQVFPLRHCTKPMDRRYPRPCLWHHLGKCLAPCSGEVSRSEYMVVVREVIGFLEGRQGDVLRELEKRMRRASERLEFETAGQLRDQISAIREIIEAQRLATMVRGEQDAIAFLSDGDRAHVEIFFIRASRLVGRDTFVLQGIADETPQAVLTGFVKQFYASSPNVPRLILLQHQIDEVGVIREWLGNKRGAAVKIEVPRRGHKRRLIEMVLANAEQSRERLRLRELLAPRALDGALEELQTVFGLPGLPRRIEGYDISNIQGTSAVGSMVVFEQGRPKTAAYRRFRIKTVPQADDYAMLREVMRRRFKRARREDAQWPRPGLVLVDGGKGQLSAVKGVFDELGAVVPLLSLAKHDEEVFVPGRRQPVRLSRRAPGLKLLQQVRDEAHRFAVSYHHNLHKKRSFKSELDGVPGIGPARKRALLRTFGSVNGIREADKAQIAAVSGVTPELAETLKLYLG